MKLSRMLLLALLGTALIPVSARAEGAEERALQLLGEMTQEQKVGQLFIVRPESLVPGMSEDQVHDNYKYGVTEMTDAMRETLKTYPVGGVCVFGKNIVDPEQITGFIQAMQAASEITLFMTVDEEGGNVARVANTKTFQVPKYESMSAVGASGEAANAYEVGKTLAGYLLPLGFNVDFAPVADVNTNPSNIVIGKRAFGSDPQLVAEMVNAELEGMHEAGLMGCVKHFPGHGDTVGDTHTGYVKITKTWEELKACELIPFLAAMENTDMVMAAHITAVNIDSDGLPASISRQIIGERLRGELGYDGVVITDAMAMGAIAQNYSDAESAVMAVQAGVDIVLMPRSLEKAFESVLSAVESGEITRERLDESVLRILRLKLKYGLIS